MTQVVLRKKTWTVEDLTHRDLELLSSASYLASKMWFCFGKSFYRLYDVGAIDEECFVTPYGNSLVRAYARMNQ